MDARRPLQRRAFLLALAALTLTLGLPFRRVSGREQIIGSLHQFMDAEVAGARSVGQSYLSEPGRQQLALQTLNEFRRLGLYRPADIARHIQARRHLDFENAAIYVQDGWVFADIEARICAIIALA